MMRDLAGSFLQAIALADIERHRRSLRQGVVSNKTHCRVSGVPVSVLRLCFSLVLETEHLDLDLDF
jgi:hypothetical protein